MASAFLPTLLIAAGFALIHVLGGRLSVLDRTPRSVWLSIAGGVSVAYVFVHLLPDLAEHQKTLAQKAGASGPWGRVEAHSYLIALLGLVTFYGLDRLARGSAKANEDAGGEGRTSAGVFWIHLSAFAMYNLLIGYLLVHREDGASSGLIIYAVAMGLHFVVNDQGLRQQHGGTYDAAGRWLLAAAPLAGWALGMATGISDLLLSALFAFLGGGIILNVLKEELPEERESRYWAFALGTGLYAALLLMAA